MQNPENNHHDHQGRHSDTEVDGGGDNSTTSFSGPLNNKRNKKSTRFSLPETTTTTAATDDYVEITLDVQKDSVAVHSVKTTGSGDVEDPELAQLAKGLEKKSSLGSSLVTNASSRFKQVSKELKRLASFTRRPHPSGRRLDRTKSAAAYALKGLKFISKTDGAAAWDGVEKRFNELTSTTHGLLPRSLFGECIGELFDALARRRNISSESITKAQLKEFWDQVADQSFDSRLQTFFDMVDKDADGRIAEGEVREIISLSASANKLSNIQNQADEYARLIMEELDPNQLGYIMIENLEMLLLQGATQTAVVNSGSGAGESRNLSKMLSEKLKPTEDHPLKRWYRDFEYFLADNWERVWVITLWIGAMGGLFGYKYVEYKNRAAFDVMGHCVCMAKGAAETLKLNMAVILLPVCRNTITWLRNKTKLGMAVPFDDNLNFHKTWMYLAVPILLYGGERLIRAFRSSIKAVKILKVAVYPGNVLALHMSKPQGFKYKSGQYIFVNCAAVSPFEWHPFSITSAPMDDYLSVHIRTLGDWTRQLKVVFSKVCQPPPSGKSGLLRADFLQGENNPNFPRVLIDGPYGAPTQDYKDYDVVLLVGLGIGATPMISVVKDIVNNMKAIEEAENALEEGSGAEAEAEAGPSPPSLTPKQGQKSGLGSGRHDFKTTRAYFYWVTREQGSFDWFKGVMNEVAEMDHKGVIEMHNYCTSVYEEGDARSALITMLQSLNHAKNGVDIVSGTRVKSHFAKPNWRTVYKRIALNHPNATVGVFYCGAPPPVKELRQLASDFSHKTSTKFEFHKENF
ncbi:hypothetical protein BUALT_Bualt02G0099000 [Buddleja alternifolia]|uniref:Uncharacterized protein n=1 Tax=Buddleja alternifolia TaxID=168488 RepID=A0AAV6Y9S7_9LAMI|nr:hypothetical protein BUALT_Bualt02G0099000 [Buddleja alternifolia]